MDFGVTDDGFVVKGFDTILADSLDRARAAFGSSVDLTSPSPLRKLIEVTAAQDVELWKRMEDLYYAQFVSTATGDALDLLGTDVGLDRGQLPATGSVKITLAGAAPGRSYQLPEATVLITGAAPVVAFTTDDPLTLDSLQPTAEVTVTAVMPGPAGNVPPGAVTGIDPAFAAIYLADVAPATLSVTNAAAFTGGEQLETDDVYRGRLAGLSRTLWTPEAVRQAVLGVTGVIDVLVSDPLGGVDVSQSYFGVFAFDQRLFNGERRLGEPYFVDVVVAHQFAAPWRTTGPVPGIFDQVLAATDLVRPVGVHLNIIEADHIDIGVRAQVTVATGHDGDALLAAIRQRLADDIGGLKLGGDVLYSQVMRAFVEQAGVIDVQQLHLRRSPPAFGRITFGNVPHQTGVTEAAVGENLAMGPTEMATFRPDTDLVDVELVNP